MLTMGNKFNKPFISIADNRADKMLLKEYIATLYKESRHIRTVDGYEAFIRKCEEELSSFFGVEEALLVNSGTDAIQLALLSLGIGKGDEVIVPAVTYLSLIHI